MLMMSLLFLISCKALSFLKSYLSSTFYIRISSIILLFTAMLNLFFFFGFLKINSLTSTGLGIYGGLYHVTSLTQWMEFFLLIIGSLILFSWPVQSAISNSEPESLILLKKGILNNIFKYKPSEVSEITNDTRFLKNSIDYSIIILFSALGASLLISSWDLLSMYISIELQSFSLYILSTLYNQSEKSTSAGLKYFLLGGLASCLILLGSGFIYSSLGLTNFESLFNLLSVHTFYELKSFHLGIIIVFIGFLIKIAAAPLHNWSPDVYDDTPTIVTIWLTIIPKISILILLLEIYSQFNIDIIGNSDFFLNINREFSETSPISMIGFLNNTLLKNLLLVISLISLIIGGIVGLSQQRIKRLLAYSTISHLGFILLALTIFSSQSIESFIFYIFQYSLTNLNIFLILIGLSYLDKRIIREQIREDFNYYLQGVRDINLISEFKSQFYNNPIIMVCLSICLFSLAGIPPLIGFFSKQFVLLSSLQEGYYFITLIGIIVSVVSASYYLKIIKEIYTEETTSRISLNLNTNSKIIKTYFQKSLQKDFNNNNLHKTKAYNIPNYLVVNSKTINGEELLLSNFHSYLISILTLFLLFFIFKSCLILNPIYLVVSSLFSIT